MRFPLALAIAATLALLPLLAPVALAAPGTSVEGCTKLSLARSGGSIFWRAGTDGSTYAAGCTDGTYHLAEGECLTFTFSYTRLGTTPPNTPAANGIYWFRDTTSNDHASTGKDNWNSAVTSSFTAGAPTDGARTYCATTTGASGGTPVTGSYRLVLRLCDLSSTCASGLTTYDVNTDTNPTCACSGTAGTGNTATAIPGYARFTELAEDPLWVSAATPVYVGESVKLTIHSEYDNGDYRTGAASDIFVYVQAPDGSWVVNGANPTQSTYPGAVANVGNYEATFTASQAGAYHVMVRLASDERSSKPFDFRVTSAPLSSSDFFAYLQRVTFLESQSNGTRTDLNATRASVNDTTSTVHGIDGNVTTTASAASGALTRADFNVWRDGEARAWRAWDNATARETTAADALAASTLASERASAEGNLTRAEVSGHGSAIQDLARAHDEAATRLILAQNTNMTLRHADLEGALADARAETRELRALAPYAGAGIAGLGLVALIVARRPGGRP